MAEAAKNLDEYRSEADARSSREDAIRKVISDLERDAENRVAKRQTVEQRWIEDLRQYNSEYEPKMVEDLKKADKSRLFVNKTRPKTDACEARLSDMLFPTDEDNWDIGPTPVPELVDDAQKAANEAARLTDQANQQIEAGNKEQAAQTASEAQKFASAAATIRANLDEARRRAEQMKAEIKDQLVECGYNKECRDVIRDACRLGTGVIVGPVGATERSRRTWRKAADQSSGAEVYQLETREDPRPALYWLDPWAWFPETDALTVQDSDSFFERHLKTRKQMRQLAREPGFNKNAIRRLLGEGPQKTLPTYIAEMRGITGEKSTPIDDRYQVWVYRGPLSTENLRAVAEAIGQADIAAPFVGEEGIDPLAEISVVLWFCQGEALKIGVHQLDSNEAIYSVFNIVKDDSSIWGFGIPYIMRNSQKALNAAWRMMMDNAGLASGPQLIVDPSVGEPVDGKWTLTARKTWRRFQNAIMGRPLLEAIEIPMYQVDLQNIINLAVKFIDDETTISVLAQGEQGSTTKTMGGMALLMNSVNVMFRRMVRAFDDGVTIPNLRRVYDWNMQFSRKEHIKGDYNVFAKGSSVLLVRELQAQNLMVLLGLSDKPDLGMAIKKLPLLRKTVQAMMVPADEVLVSDEEMKQIIEAEAQKEPAIPPDVQAKIQIAQIDAETKLKLGRLTYETEMMRLAQMHNMTLDQLRTRLATEEIKAESKERVLAGEAAMEARKIKAGDKSGSGGSLS